MQFTKQMSLLATGLLITAAVSAQQQPEPTTLRVYTTAMGTDLRLSETAPAVMRPADQALESDVSVFVYPELQFQTLVGIGGAITDASAEVFAKLSAPVQEALLNAYFDTTDGIGYNLVRVPIHSSDFSSESFTYVTATDAALSTFSIDHDRQYRLPMLARVQEKTGDQMVLYASPWSPPPFMKTNGSMLQGGKLIPEYAGSWAQYYVRFIQEYEKEGFPVWGITIQNEPLAVQRWESCIYTAEEERDFLKYHLGPAMHQAAYADKKIIVWDHNRDLIFQRAAIIFGDPIAAAYAWGIGFHWYETWAGGEPMFGNLRRVKEAFPDKELIFTEGCQERFDSEKLQFWPNAERYGKSMINDFNEGTAAWTDWNILLDENGGPNHVGNFCFAPVHADLQSDSLICTPSYYYIGHFSKFIRPGASRLGNSGSRSHLMATSFQNTDGSIVTVVMNSTDQPVNYQLYVGDVMTDLTIPARAMQSLVL